MLQAYVPAPLHPMSTIYINISFSAYCVLDLLSITCLVYCVAKTSP